jgi:hypothetical protein
MRSAVFFQEFKGALEEPPCRLEQVQPRRRWSLSVLNHIRGTVGEIHAAPDEFSDRA